MIIVSGNTGLTSSKGNRYLEIKERERDLIKIYVTIKEKSIFSIFA